VNEKPGPMHAHALPPRDRYQLRNDAKVTFEMRSSATGSGLDGCVVKVAVTRHDGHKFRYEIVFRGEYSASKPGFTEDMYHETGLSVVRSQLESHVHRDTRICLEVNSGLPRSEVGASFDWEEP
jgi:hypothetical protein